MKNNFLMYKWRNTRKIEDTQNFTHSKFMLDFGLALLSNISCKCLFMKKGGSQMFCKSIFFSKQGKCPTKRTKDNLIRAIVCLLCWEAVWLG